MAQHITITDDDSNIATAFTVEPSNDNAPPRVTSLTITASNGAGVTASDLDSLLGAVGLVTLTRVAALPAVPADALPPATQTRSDGKPYRRAPADDQLVPLLKAHQLDARAVAEQLDVPVSTVKSWIQRLRKRGLLPQSTRSRTRRNAK